MSDEVKTVKLVKVYNKCRFLTVLVHRFCENTSIQMKIYCFYCMAPENIHTHPEDIIGNYEGKGEVWIFSGTPHF